MLAQYVSVLHEYLPLLCLLRQANYSRYRKSPLFSGIPNQVVIYTDTDATRNVADNQLSHKGNGLVQNLDKDLPKDMSNNQLKIKMIAFCAFVMNMKRQHKHRC